MKSIMITTEHRGVFYGEVADDEPLNNKHVRNLANARMAIRFGTEHGVAQLASTGPTSASKIGATADMPIIRDVTAIWAVTDEAAAAWRNA